jgi:hypothetical protein
VPHIVEELIGREMVAAPPLEKDFPSSLTTGDKVAEVRSRVICPPSVGASVVVVCEPTEAQVFLSPSQESIARSSSARVVMTQCISYMMCHEKVVK